MENGNLRSIIPHRSLTLEKLLILSNELVICRFTVFYRINVFLSNSEWPKFHWIPNSRLPTSVPLIGSLCPYNSSVCEQDGLNTTLSPFAFFTAIDKVFKECGQDEIKKMATWKNALSISMISDSLYLGATLVQRQRGTLALDPCLIYDVSSDEGMAAGSGTSLRGTPTVRVVWPRPARVTSFTNAGAPSGLPRTNGDL